MRVALGGDHAGFPLKQPAASWIKDLGHEVIDVGPFAYDPDDDYPDFTFKVTDAVVSGRAVRGVLVCGSGVGASVAANKVPGIRCAICHDTYSAHQGVEHDDMNVLALGGRVVGEATARELIAAFLSAEFTGEERHRRRLSKVLKVERDGLDARIKSTPTTLQH